MNKYILRFWFDFGGICFWGINDLAKSKLGYAIENNDLPISNTLIDKLNRMQEEFGTIIDWNNPTNTSNWTDYHKQDFLKRANEVSSEIQEELGAEFEIINDVLKNMS